MDATQSATISVSPTEMSRECCVPGCNSNYKDTTMFGIPDVDETRALWLQNISRKNLKVTKNSFVCIKHFSEKFIIRCDTSTLLNGSNLTIPRKIPRLGKEAYPSLYLPSDSIETPETPHCRARDLVEEDKCVVQKPCEGQVSDFCKKNKTNNSKEESINGEGKKTIPTICNESILKVFESSGENSCEAQYLSDVSSTGLSTPPSPKTRKRKCEVNTLLENIIRFHEESSIQQKQIVQGLKDINDTLKILIDIIRSK